MIRCFLIDDDVDDQEIFCMALEEVIKDFECMVANDGPEALTLLKDQSNNAPDYIFIDVNMPKMNGVRCLKEIKLLKHIHARVFMLSTTSEESLINECKDLGAEDFIVKPPSLSALTTKLKQIIHD